MLSMGADLDKQQIPFDFAQGRLSTPPFDSFHSLRVRSG